MLRTRVLKLTVLVALGVLAACAETPITGRNQLMLISDQEAAQIGAQAYQEILAEKPAVTGAPHDRVQRIGERIVAVAGAGPKSWEFNAIRDDTPNAFALPGGKVGVNTGMLDMVENDAQLAAVLAHEIAHVMAHHSAERLSRGALTQLGVQVIGDATNSPGLTNVLAQAATLGVTLPFTRSQEAEADEIGLHYMARAGFDPNAAVRLWELFEAQGGEHPPEFLSTHPSPGNRAERLRKLVGEVMPVYRQNAAKN